MTTQPAPCAWHQTEAERAAQPEGTSHTICKPCMDRIVADWRADNVAKLNQKTAHTLAAAGERLGRVL
jgi:hypothetical protein